MSSSLKSAFEPPRQPRWMLIASTATFAACVASVFLALALIGYGWGWAIAALATYIAAAFTAHGAYQALGRRRSIAFLSVAVITALGAVVGSTSTEIVNGRPVSSWSTTARIAHDVADVDSYLRTLQRADALLVLDQTNARARLNEITAMRATTQNLATDILKRKGASDESTMALVSIAKAADAAYQALDNLTQLLAQYDTRREAEIANLRETLIDEALNAAAYSRQAAATVGIPVGVQE